MTFQVAFPISHRLRFGGRASIEREINGLGDNLFSVPVSDSASSWRRISNFQDWPEREPNLLSQMRCAHESDMRRIVEELSPVPRLSYDT